MSSLNVLFIFRKKYMYTVFPRELFFFESRISRKFKYCTRAIITRGLYFFHPIFHRGLYLRAVYTAERLVFAWIFFHLRLPQKNWIGKLKNSSSCCKSFSFLINLQCLFYFFCYLLHKKVELLWCALICPIFFCISTILNYYLFELSYLQALALPDKEKKIEGFI